MQFSAVVIRAKARAVLSRARAIAFHEATLPLIVPWLTLRYWLRYHEPWRDEAHTLLISRDVPWSHMFAVARQEGAPPAFHCLLKILTYVMPGYVALGVGAAIGFGVLIWGIQSVFRALGARPELCALGVLALLDTDTITYELGIIARPYAMGFGLALACIAACIRSMEEKRPTRTLVVAGVLGGLATVTTTHAGCIAGPALLGVGLVHLARGQRARALLPLVVLAPFLLLDFSIIADYPRAQVSTQNYDPTFTYAKDIAETFLKLGLGPTRWWFNAADYAAYAARNVESPLHHGLLFAAAVSFASSKAGARRAVFAVVAVALSWLCLGDILLLHYGGWFRHWIHLWIPAIVLALGVLLALPEGRSYPAILARTTVAVVGLSFFAPWWLGQRWALDETLKRDREQLFSETKAAARVLPKDADVVATSDYFIEPVRLWRPDVRLRSASGNGRRFRYVVPDPDWVKRVDWRPLVADECRGQTTEIVFAAESTTRDPCLAELPHEHRPQAWEQVYLYRVDCTCWLAKR